MNRIFEYILFYKVYESNIRIYSEISKLRIEYSNIFVWSKLNICIWILDIRRTIFEYSSFTCSAGLYNFRNSWSRIVLVFSQTFLIPIYHHRFNNVHNITLYVMFMLENVQKEDYQNSSCCLVFLNPPSHWRTRKYCQVCPSFNSSLALI